MTLYELSNEYQRLLEFAEEENLTQEDIADTLEGLDYEIEDKAESYAIVIQTLQADISGLKAEIKRLTDRKNTIDNNIKTMKFSLENAMRATGKTKFKTKLFSFNIQKNPPSVKIAEGAELPEAYLIPQEPKVDRKALLKDLKAGAWIDGVEVVQTEGLRIR